MSIYSGKTKTTGLLMRPVFLIGMGRSGTTLLADILARHQDLFWLSNYQNRIPGMPAVSLINRLNDNEFIGVRLSSMRNKAKGWRRISKLLPAQSEAHYIWAKYGGPTFPDSYMLGQTSTDQQRDAFRTFLEGVGDAQGKRRFFHKFTGPARIGFLQSIFPDAIFVNLVRDPRAVIASLLESGFWVRGGGTERLWWDGSGVGAEELAHWQGTDLLPVALGALQWDRIAAHTLEEAANILHPDQILNIRYEDFTEAPREVVQRVLKACDLPASCRIDDFLRNIKIRNNMNNKFISQFNADELSVISALTSETASRFGYEL